MSRTTVFIGSVTHAMRGQRLLSSRGISSEMAKAQKHDDKKSCGYILRFPTSVQEEAFSLLRENGIRFTLWKGGA